MTGLYPNIAPASGAFPITTAFSTVVQQQSSDANNTNDVANYAWAGVDTAPTAARCASTGSETYTIVSGSATTITGTTLDGISVAVNDPVLLKDCPASSGTGSVGSSNPANGLYYVTAVATNITVARAGTMSATSAQPNPAGRVVFVRAGTANVMTMWTVTAPAADLTFTYGTTAMQWKLYSLAGNGIPNSAINYAVGTGVPNAANQQAGINNFNTSLQSQVVVSGTSYYITNSNLVMPATPLTGMVANETTFTWDITLTKTAAGTGTFAIVLYRGTHGSTSDTADVTQTLGTQTAVADNMELRIMLVVTATGASGSYYWTICPSNSAGSAVGFGIPSSGGYFASTKSSVAMNTASLNFGIGFIATTGTPTVTAPMVRAFAYNMN